MPFLMFINALQIYAVSITIRIVVSRCGWFSSILLLLLLLVLWLHSLTDLLPFLAVRVLVHCSDMEIRLLPLHGFDYCHSKRR